MAEALKIKKSKKALKESDIAAFERETGVTLPADYRAFLLANNGGVPDRARYDTVDGKVSGLVKCFISIDGRKEGSLSDEFESFTGSWIPANLIPIAVNPGDDDRVVLSVSGKDAGSVYNWAWGEEPEKPKASYKYMRLIADSFTAFCDKLMYDED